MLTGKNEIFCNCCGKKIETESFKNREEYLELKKEWGYFSDKDGQIHQSHICESCYDRWIRQFVLPVTVTEQTELL